LLNARGGAFCALHEQEYGQQCRVVGCNNNRDGNTLACETHGSTWRKHIKEKSKSTIRGLRRILQRPGERQEWQQQRPARAALAHDDIHPPDEVRKHYFSPNRFYCVETICAPCGVVIAWTKFDKSESPTNILNWLGTVYPDPETRPSYVCIDKACQVLRTVVAQGNRWGSWKESSRFIVDSYHYINHKASDCLCRTWCNPAPLDGSAPNLVDTQIGPDGEPYQVSLIISNFFLLIKLYIGSSI